MKYLVRIAHFSLAIALFLCSIFFVGCSGGYMQNNGQSTSNGSIRVGQQQRDSALTMADSDNFNGGVTIPEMPSTNRCISIFTEIPDELQEKYASRIRKDELLKDSADNKVSVEPGIHVFAFTFPGASFDASSEKSRCDFAIEPESNIEFVTADVNKILELYIKAVVRNSSEISDTKRQLDVKPSNKLSIKLCQDIQCAFGDAASTKSFDIESEADLKYARSFTDTILGVNTLNDLRRLNTDGAPDFILNDSEINELLRLTYNLAISQVSVEIR